MELIKNNPFRKLGLESVIKNQRPTISLDILQKYEKIKNEMEGKKEERRRIGFNT